MTQFPSQTSANGLWTLKKVNRNLQGSNFPTFPGAPTSVTATSGNASATVTFAAPASTGGSSITSYTVTSSPGGITASGASSPITVTGLTNGTAYTFTVKATSFTNGPSSSASNSVTPAAPTNWTRIATITGDSSTSGTVSVSGYTQLLVFGTAPGGNGGGGGDDDGGGGGGSGAVQISGYQISLAGGVTQVYYETPAPVAATSTSNPGAYQSNLKLRNTNSTGTVIFELNAGQNGACNPVNSTTPAPGGLGGASNAYSSHAGVNGGAGATRLPSGSGTNASTGQNATAQGSGGGGGGAWYVSGNDTSTGVRGGIGAGSSSVSTYGTGSLTPVFSVVGGSYGSGGVRPNPGSNATTANGGGASAYAGGGGAGAGLQFFGSGNLYGAGGGGGGGQEGAGVGGGKGGAAYLTIYAR